MSEKIIGATIGTPISPSKIEDNLKPVKSVNGKAPDENGNVEVVGNNGKDGVNGKDGIGIAEIRYMTGGEDSEGRVQKHYDVIYTDGNARESIVVTDGKDGADGKDGVNGKTPYIQNGYWYIDGVNTGVKAEAIDGKNGVDGEDGVSPTVSVSAITGGHRITITDKNGTKTVDIMDGNDGEDGSKGADGRGIKTVARTSGTGAAGTTDTYTITYTDNTTSTFTVYNGKNGTNGTSVTVQSVSESSADGGNNVVTFSDGKTVTVKNGKTGAPGKDGTNYVLTDADKTQIANIVITQLGGEPIFGYVDDNNNIVVKGNLADGNYSVKYEMEDGSTIDIGDMTLGTTENLPVRANYTNIFNPSAATINKRASISSGYSTCDGAVVSDFINIEGKFTVGQPMKIYVEGATIERLNASSHYPRAIYYTTKPASGTANPFANPYSAAYTNGLTQVDEGNGVISFTVAPENYKADIKYMVIMLTVKDTAITTDDIKDIVVTIDEPIFL